MISALKIIQKVNAFLVCLNSEDPRIDQGKQEYLKLIG